MWLYLVQHGEAKAKEEDPERPLTVRGLADIQRMGAMLDREPAGPDRILHSGKTRARETAEVLAEWAKPSHGVEPADGLDPMADPQAWADRLGDDERSLMLVGHLPHLAKLASLLLTGDSEREIVRFQPGSILCVEREDSGRWSVQWLVVPQLVG